MDIENNIERITESGCWIWMGSIANRGYGSVKIDGKQMSAHRAVYQQLVGNVPEGKQLDHLCRIRCCVNPSHLEPVTQRENIMRGVSFSAVNNNKTHCIHGHPFSPENTFIIAGYRRCKICKNKFRMASYYRIQARKKSEANHV